MLGGRNDFPTRINLDRNMLTTMLAMFDTHAGKDGKLRVDVSEQMLTVQNPQTGRNELLGVNVVPHYLRGF